MPIKYYLWAALAGAFIPVMAVLNARLGASLGESMHAPVVLFSVGVVATVASAFFVSGSLPSPHLFPRVAWVDLVGGFIVAFYVISSENRCIKFHYVCCVITGRIVTRYRPFWTSRC